MNWPLWPGVTTGAGIQTLGLHYIPLNAWDLHSPGNGALGELDVGGGAGAGQCEIELLSWPITCGDGGGVGWLSAQAPVF